MNVVGRGWRPREHWWLLLAETDPMTDPFPSHVHRLNATRGLRENGSPRVVALVNDHYVKVARLQGDSVWHAHDDEDELFLVLDGELRIDYRDRPAVLLQAGSLHVVPRGVPHCPVAVQE